MEDTTAGSTGAPRRRWVAVVAVITLVAGGLAVALTVTGSRDGATTAQGAAEQLFTGIAAADPVGVLQALPPSEREPLTASLPDLLAQLQRLGLTGTVDQRKLAGLGVDVDSLQFRSVRLADKVQAVDVVAGRLVVTAGDALPVQQDGKEVLDELGVDVDKGELLRRDFAQYPLRLVAVDEGGGWHISLAYSVAENLRRTYAKGAPDPGTAGPPLPAIGAETPDGAVRSMVEAYAAGDLPRAFGMLDPTDGAVFADYARVFLPDVAKARGKGAVHKLELRTDGTGDTRTVHVDELDVDLDDVVQTIHVESEKDCFGVDYRFGDRPAYARFESCGRGKDEKVIGGGEAGASEAEREREQELEREREREREREQGRDSGEQASDTTPATTRSGGTPPSTVAVGPEKPPIKGTPAEAAREQQEEERQTRPIDNAFSALALFGNGSQLPPLTVVQRDGRWYVSPVRTLVGGTLDTLKQTEDGEQAVEVVRGLKDLLEPRRALALEEAGDPDNVLFGPAAVKKNPLVPACFVRIVTIAGESGIGAFGGDCVEELISTGRAKPEDTPQLLSHGDCLAAQPSAPPALDDVYRKGYLIDRAIRRCLQAKVDKGLADASVFGGLRNPAEQACWDPYRGLADTAPETDWKAADTKVHACFDALLAPPAASDPTVAASP